MPFIEVTTTARLRDDPPVKASINVDHIQFFGSALGGSTGIVLSDGRQVMAHEDYDTIRLAIERIHRIVVPSQIETEGRR